MAWTRTAIGTEADIIIQGIAPLWGSRAAFAQASVRTVQGHFRRIPSGIVGRFTMSASARKRRTGAEPKALPFVDFRDSESASQGALESAFVCARYELADYRRTAA